MNFQVLGINHDSADIAIREKVAFAPEQVVSALQQAHAAIAAEEIAILSTCNRTEIYLGADAEVSAVLAWLASFHELPAGSLASCHYAYQGEDAIRHMAKVACGLDSLVLGEPQILGQMKSSYAVAVEANTVGRLLHQAFQQVFAIAKRVRTETAIGENPVSVAYAAVSLAQQIFATLKDNTALLIGAGETIELVARHLHQQGMSNILVANRTLSHARELAEQFGAHAILLSDIPEQLHRADIVISSTASQLPILGKGAVESALKKRRHKPMFMVDIAVPRDIEPQVGDLADVYLYSVDDLRGVIEESRRSREEAAEKAQQIIVEGVEQFQRKMRALDAVSTIRSLREKSEQIRLEEIDKAQRQLERGVAAADVLQQLSRGLMNKFLHEPSAALQQAAAEGDNITLNLARRLMGLEQDAPMAPTNEQDSDE